jgi:formiminoglutamate deiminase
VSPDQTGNDGRTSYHCALAWLPPGRVAADVVVVVEAGRVVLVTERSAAPSGAELLGGLVLPGFANTHSHAFHRALRGRTQAPTDGRGSFWTWREQMYAVAGRLDPDSYRVLARATYVEMALAGVTAVGEFHYLHHGPGGVAYDDPNVMGHAVLEAARDAGIRIALLDTCYLSGGIGQPLEGVQRRFSDGDADAWARRVDLARRAVAGRPDAVVGAAVHSVRGVPPDQVSAVVAWADEHERPLHVHLSEQRAENEACLAAYGVTPTRLLHEHGALGARTTVVHATHLADDDVDLLGRSGTGACFCPTTERDLADGIGPARRLVSAGSPLSLGSDSHAVIDLLEEARAVELDERLASGARGHFAVGELLDAATVAGQRALGFDAAGRIEAGATADLVAVRLDSVRTAGATAATAVESVVFAGTASDVTDVVASGRRLVRDGRHVLVEDPARDLATAIAAVLD